MVVVGGGDGRAPTSDTSWDEDGNPARNSDVFLRGGGGREKEPRANTLRKLACFNARAHTAIVDIRRDESMLVHERMKRSC